MQGQLSKQGEVKYKKESKENSRNQRRYNRNEDHLKKDHQQT